MKESFLKGVKILDDEFKDGDKILVTAKNSERPVLEFLYEEDVEGERKDKVLDSVEI